MFKNTHTHLIARPASEAVGMELVDMENMDRTLDAEVMQLAGHFQVQQVILRQKKEKVSKRLSRLHAATHPPEDSPR